LATGRLGNLATDRTPARAILLAVLFVFLARPGCSPTFASDDRAHHVVVLGDPHLPGKHLAAKTAVIEKIGGGADVDGVVVLGDICEDRGTAEEYAFATQFFSALSQPAHFLVGNHDYIYDDATSAKGGRIRAGPASRAEKLQRFKTTFGLDEVYASRRVGNYLLIFMSTDHLLSRYLAHVSDRQLEWLRAELGKHRATPTVIFYHAPLRGTLLDYNDRTNKDDFVAHPTRSCARSFERTARCSFGWRGTCTCRPRTRVTDRRSMCSKTR